MLRKFGFPHKHRFYRAIPILNLWPIFDSIAHTFPRNISQIPGQIHSASHFVLHGQISSTSHFFLHNKGATRLHKTIATRLRIRHSICSRLMHTPISLQIGVQSIDGYFYSLYIENGLFVLIIKYLPCF